LETLLEAEKGNSEFLEQAVNALLESEYYYSCELEEFTETYALPLKEGYNGISETEKNGLLINFFSILHFHNKFYSQIYESCVEGGTRDLVGQLFLESSEEFRKLYYFYFSSYPTAIEIYMQIKTSSEFQEFLKRCSQKKSVDYLNVFPIYLNKPILRLKVYPKLLKDLARNTSDSAPAKKQLTEAILIFDRIVGSAERIKKLRTTERLLASSDIQGLHFSQLSSCGSLQHCANVLMPNSDKKNLKNLLLLVYVDFLIVLYKNFKGNKVNFSLKDKFQFSQVKATKCQCENYDFAFSLLINNKVSMICICNTPAELEETINFLNKPREERTLKVPVEMPPITSFSASTSTSTKKSIKGAFKNFKKANKSKPMEETLAKSPERTTPPMKHIKSQTLKNENVINFTSNMEQHSGSKEVVTKSQSFRSNKAIAPEISGPRPLQFLHESCSHKELINAVNTLYSMVNRLQSELQLLKESLQKQRTGKNS
jgi:hypothetical protein